MTAVYQHANEVTVILAYSDDDGNAVTPVSVAYRVLDAVNAEIVASTAVSFTAGDLQASVVVSKLANTLTNSVRDMRTVEVTITTDAGNLIKTESYIVQRGARLQVSENTAQTYEEAVLNGLDMPQAIGWAAKDKIAREAALIEAYHRLDKLNYKVRGVNEGDMSRLKTADVTYIDSLLGLTAEELADLDTNFLIALKKAQVIEADTILNGDVIDNHRRSGLMSQTVGESSQMFRPGKPLIMPVSARTLRYLTGYVDHTIALGRG